MKYHVQFTEIRNEKWDAKQQNMIKVPGFTVEAMGSDSVFILDGRNSLVNMIVDAKNRLAKMNELHHYSGFKIKIGSRFESASTLYEY